jgi:hypothetical protein
MIHNGNDKLVGQAGGDKMAEYHGTPGNDDLSQAALGLAPGSLIFGEGGDDRIAVTQGAAVGGAGNDTITGASRTSAALYWDAATAVSVNLATGQVQDGQGGIDTLVNIHTVHLTWQNDTVVGSSGDDTFWDLGGSDTIDGGAGNDTVVFWEGAVAQSTISYDPATQTLTVVKASFGGAPAGTDVLRGIETLLFFTSSGASETVQLADLVGPFRTHTTQAIPGGNSVQQWVEGDFNGDGKADLWVNRLDGASVGVVPTPVQILLGDGQGHFTDGTASVFPQGAPFVHYTPRLAAADLNGDGITDVYAPDFGVDGEPFTGGQNRLFVSANGVLTDQSAQLLQRLTQGHGVSLGDVDGNGTTDILVNGLNDRSGRADEVILNNGNGTFTTRTDLFPAAIQVAGSYTAGHTWSFMGDLNGDGRTDVVLGTWDARGGPSQVLLASGPAVFAPSGIHALPDSGVDRPVVVAIKAIDLNGDALPDLALSVTNGGEHDQFYQVPYVQLLVNQGDGIFSDETQSRLPQDPLERQDYWYKFIDVVDIDGDGDDDMLLSSDTREHAGELYLNDGAGHFALARTFAGYAGVHAMDVNGDAIPEIVTGSESSVTVFRNDIFTGAAGALHFRAGERPEAVAGGAGVDHVAYTGAASGYGLSHTASGWSVYRTALDTDTLVNIERLDFADAHVALDFDGHAGTVAKLLGAVFGSASVHSPAYVGIGLQLADAGMPDAALAAMALDARLGANASHEDVVRTLYTNVFGVAPAAGDLAHYAHLLDDGTFTPAGLALLAAGTASNLANIGFDGLWSAGLAYA